VTRRGCGQQWITQMASTRWSCSASASDHQRVRAHDDGRARARARTQHHTPARWHLVPYMRSGRPTTACPCGHAHVNDVHTPPSAEAQEFKAKFEEAAEANDALISASAVPTVSGGAAAKDDADALADELSSKTKVGDDATEPAGGSADAEAA
jgi:hypothetical protein